MTSSTTFANGVITIQNLDGGLFFLACCVMFGLGIWASLKHEATEDPSPLKRCQSCGAQIDLIDGQWEHVDDNVMLVVRCNLPHLPEPTQAVER